MAKMNGNVAGFLIDENDSWFENISRGEENLKEFDDTLHHLQPSTSSNNPGDQTLDNNHSIDFTLHTIVEESCEDSELELFCNKFSDSIGEVNKKIDTFAMDMERCFDFEDRDISSNCLEYSSSEILSDFSDIVEQEFKTLKIRDTDQIKLNLSTSGLEKYFLSEFMGFSVENKSDSSVGSDSEGKASLNQRKKKLRTRRTPRSNQSYFDNLLLETAGPGELSNDCLGSSESDIDIFPKDVITRDKFENIYSAKRKKNYRKRELFEQVYPNKHDLNEVNKEQFSKITPRGRSDSFNNWSSDEEINIMMSKLRQFFKSLISVKTNTAKSNNFCISTDQEIVVCKTTDIQFPYFESELIRLMKTVPGINNQQLREIVDYLSSEDTWSDSNDSLDLNVSNVDVFLNNEKRIQVSAESISKPEHHESVGCANKVDTTSFIETEKAMMYTNLFESIILKKSRIRQNKIIMYNNENDNKHYISKSLKTGELLVNIWQHIGQKLVNLMREASIESDCGTTRNTESITEISNLNIKEIPNKRVLDSMECLVALDQHACLPRSPSCDILLGTTNRSWGWQSYSNNGVNDSETSDCDRFSWRGSFESALLAPGDSRNKLVTSGRENCSRISQWSLLKRGSVDNLWCKNVQNREYLDRVKSWESIIGNDEIQCRPVNKIWLSTLIPNKSNEDSSFARKIHEHVCTNSLPRLQSLQSTANISNHLEFDPSDISPSAKSARYRSPGSQPNISITASTVKKNEKQIRGETSYGNYLHKNLTSSSSLGDSSLPELNCNINNSPVLKGKLLFQRNTTNFREHSESLTSLCSDYRYENVKVRGQVEFGVQYNYKINALEIHVVQCKYLASVSTKRCKCDPYVKVYVLPDLYKCGKRKTKVKKQTLNPVFNETLRFHIPISKLTKHYIWLTVWNSDLIGRNNFFGEVILDLEDRVFDKPQSQWYTLQQKSSIVEDDPKCRGSLVVALKFIPSEMYTESSSTSTNANTSPLTKGTLCILVKEAKYLYSNRKSGFCNTFCKSYLLPVRTKSTKQKTHVIQKSFNPMWNFTFLYEDLTINELSMRALELTVWNHDRLISNQFIGGVRFSLGTGQHIGNNASWMKSNNKERFLWREMMNRPHFWVEGSVKLRSNLNDTRECSNESHPEI